MRYKSVHKTAKKIIHYLRHFLQLLHRRIYCRRFNRSSNRSNRLFHAKAYTRSNESDWQRTEIVWRTVDYIWIGV